MKELSYQAADTKESLKNLYLIDTSWAEFNFPEHVQVSVSTEQFAAFFCV